MEKYFSLYIIWNDADADAPYIKYMKAALQEASEKCVYIYTEKSDLKDAREKICRALEGVRCGHDTDFTGALILDSDLYGPFFPLKQFLFGEFLEGTDVLTNVFTYSGQDDGGSIGLCREFLYVRAAVINDMIDSLKYYQSAGGMEEADGMETADAEKRLYEYCGKKQWRIKSIFRQTIEERRRDKYSPRADICFPYEAIRRYGYPFMSKRCFDAAALLRYSMQQELPRAMRYIDSHTDYEVDYIWRDIIQRCNPYDLKNLLHLDFVIPGCGSCLERGCNMSALHPAIQPAAWRGMRTGIFLHLYYEDLFDDALEYMAGIPEWADIYISTSAAHMEDLGKKLRQRNIRVCKIVEGGRKGRDAGALLISFKTYILKYDLICFCHDKKTSGGIEAPSVGKTFMNLIWESLLKDGGHIRNIVALFVQNKRLGLLSPPMPLMGNYMQSVVGNGWTVCFEETEKLAAKLGLCLDLDKNKQIFALSTAFWCRVDALKPLFDYPWSYDDFPEEPLALDGTINHAIERILPYIAQSRGYFSGIATTQEYASVYTSDLMYAFNSVLGGIYRSHLFIPQFPFDIEGDLETFYALYDFCGRHKKIAIYGAGAQARIMLYRLRKVKKEPEFLIVTRRSHDSSLEGYEIKALSEVKDILDEQYGLILAMSAKFQEEVSPLLAGIGAEIYRI